MAIALPLLPLTNHSVEYRSNSTVLTPSFGGPQTRINRLGDRFSLKLNVDALGYHQAVALIADLNAGQTQKVIAKVPLPFNVGTPGSPKVSTAGQAGMTLAINTLTSGYKFNKGQFITLISSGVRYLHQVTATITATGTTCTVPIQPMLRVSPAVNDLVLVAQPEIEGFLGDGAFEYSVDRLSTVGLSFEVSESC